MPYDLAHLIGYDNAPGNNKCCNQQLNPFYSDEMAFEIVKEAYSEENTFMHICLSENEVVAFHWCRKENGLQLNNDICREPTVNLKDALDIIKHKMGNRLPDYYMVESEVGVRPDFRGQKISSELYRHAIQLHLRAPTQIEAIVLTTNVQSPLFYLRKKLGFETIHEFKDSDKVLLFLKL